VVPDDTLGKALKIIIQEDIDKVAILDDTHKVLGYLRYIDLLNAYHNEIKMNSKPVGDQIE
jgi:CIC family chloride channel protein